MSLVIEPSAAPLREPPRFSGEPAWLADLRRAAWPNGTLLHVPRGVAVEGVLRVSVEAFRPDAAVLPLTFVLTEPESSVTLLEEVISPDGTGWWAGGVEVVAGAGSRVRYAQLQRLGDGIWNLGSQLVEVGQDADVKTLNTEVGSESRSSGSRCA